jgi:hypothetical protein
MPSAAAMLARVDEAHWGALLDVSKRIDWQASASAALLAIGSDSLCTRGAVHPYLDKALGSYLATPDFFDQCQ